MGVTDAKRKEYLVQFSWRLKCVAILMRQLRREAAAVDKVATRVVAEVAELVPSRETEKSKL